MVAEGAPDAAFWSRYTDGWGLVRGTVRLGSGEPVGDCGVLYYAMTPPTDRIPEILVLTSADGTYDYPLPAGTYTMAANGGVSRVDAAGGIVSVPVIGKVTGVTVSSHQIVIAHITVTERPDLIGKTGDVADLLDIRGSYGRALRSAWSLRSAWVRLRAGAHAVTSAGSCRPVRRRGTRR
jgi:hypothetical protein